MALFLTEDARQRYDHTRKLHCWHPGSIPDLDGTQQCCHCGTARGEWLGVDYGDLHGPHIKPGYGDYRRWVDRTMEECEVRKQRPPLGDLDLTAAP
jgi:hypothetical protein